MGIAGSNTFYMKISSKIKTSSLLPAGIVVSLGDIYLTPYLTNKKLSWKHKEMTDKKQAQKWEDWIHV